MTGIVTFGVTVAAGLGMIAAAIVIMVLPRFKAVKWARFTVLPLIMAGTAGLLTATVAGISISGATSRGTAALASGALRLLPGSGYAIPIMCAVAAAAVLVHDMLDGMPERKGIIAAVLVPVTLGFIPGGFGALLQTLFGLPAAGLSAAVSAAFGLG